MICPKCNHEIKEGSNFCNECGSLLSDRSLQNKLSEVNRYFNENKLQEVDGILFQLEKEYPNHPEVLNNIGLLHLKHNNNEEAGKYFHKAVELDPNNLTYRHNFEMIQPNKSYYRNDIYSDFNRNTQTEYAGFWIRFFAFLIDYFIIFGLLVFASFIISGFQSFTTSDGEFILYQLLRYPIFIVIPWLYYSLMESSSKQATLGKILLHIKVTDLHRQKISFGRSTGRFFARILSTLIFYIGFIMAAFTSKKQTLHDLIAECLVLKR